MPALDEVLPLPALSGGETFVHAGACPNYDVIESPRGNICLDAIFIDEGYGSPNSDGDAGALERVLQPSQDLVGRSRAIGLHLAPTARSTGCPERIFDWLS